jgi:hypothetical protein
MGRGDGGRCAGVAVGRGRNGSADSGQGGPVRIRGGSSGERWRSGPVRSLMAAVLRRAEAGGRRRAGRRLSRAEDLGVDGQVVAGGVGFNAPIGPPTRRSPDRRPVRPSGTPAGGLVAGGPDARRKTGTMPPTRRCAATTASLMEGCRTHHRPLRCQPGGSARVSVFLGVQGYSPAMGL